MSALRRVAAAALYPVVVLGLAEAVCQVAHRVEHGTWLALGFPGEQIEGAFRRHPHLVGVPTPGFARTESGVSLSHNERGFRGPEPRPRREGVTRIVALGGSTTYGTGVSDDETWPHLLGRELGPRFEVLNLGVPGHSTAENAIQTALLLSDLAPDLAVYLEGWNDVRNSHVGDLAPDYANFHAPHVYWSLGLFQLRTGNRSALLHYARALLDATLVRDPISRARYRASPQRLTPSIDRRLLALYRRNLVSIVALCRAQGIHPVLVPQVLNWDALTGDEPTRWIPLLRGRDVGPAMRAFNRALVTTGRAQGAGVVAAVLEAPFGPDDFLDHGHFTPSGNAKFAKILADYVRETAATGLAPGSGPATPRRAAPGL